MLEGEFHNLLKVNDNKKYNGMGYMGCNGYVPCQVRLRKNDLSLESYKKE